MRKSEGVTPRIITMDKALLLLVLLATRSAEAWDGHSPLGKAPAAPSAAPSVPLFAPWLEGLRLRSQGRQEEACAELRGLLESLPSTTLSPEHAQASYVPRPQP